MHTNVHAAIYTYQLQDQYRSSTTHACQALIDQSIRHFGINYTSVRHYGIRHFGIRHSGNHPIEVLYYYNTDKCTDKHEA